MTTPTCCVYGERSTLTRLDRRWWEALPRGARHHELLHVPEAGPGQHRPRRRPLPTVGRVRHAGARGQLTVRADRMPTPWSFCRRCAGGDSLRAVPTYTGEPEAAPVHRPAGFPLALFASSAITFITDRDGEELEASRMPSETSSMASASTISPRAASPPTAHGWLSRCWPITWPAGPRASFWN